MKIEYLLPSQYHYLFECKVTNKFLIRTKHFVLHTIFFAIFLSVGAKCNNSVNILTILFLLIQTLKTTAPQSGFKYHIRVQRSYP